MVGVVGDGNMLAEERFVHALKKAGPLIGYGGGGEIVKEKTHQIEDCGGFEDYRVFSWCQFLRVFCHLRFLAGAFSELLRIEITNIAGVGFGPTGSWLVLHGDGKFSVR